MNSSAVHTRPLKAEFKLQFMYQCSLKFYLSCCASLACNWLKQWWLYSTSETNIKKRLWWTGRIEYAFSAGFMQCFAFKHVLNVFRRNLACNYCCRGTVYFWMYLDAFILDGFCVIWSKTIELLWSTGFNQNACSHVLVHL